MNAITIGNLAMSLVLAMVGVYDVTHELHVFGIVELWISGGCFVAALHTASKRRVAKEH